MNFSDYQKQSKVTAKYPGVGDNFTYPTLGLVSEAGEIADKVKKLSRDQNIHLPSELSSGQKDELLKEAGDVLWYVSCLVTELGADLGDVATKNIEKTHSRLDRGKLGGSGDNR